MIFLQNKQILVFHSKNDKIYALQPLEGDTCTKFSQTVLMKIGHSVPEHSILAHSAQDRDVLVLFSEQRINIFTDFGIPNLLEVERFFRTEVSINVMPGHKISQFRQLKGRKVLSLCENFSMFLHSYDDSKSSFLHFLEFGASSINKPGLLTHVFEVAKDDKLAAVTSHNNSNGARDKLFIIDLENNQVNLKSEKEFPENEKTPGSLIFSIDMSFKLENKQLVTCFELGNHQKVEMFEVQKHTVNKVEEADFAFEGVCLMIRRIYGEIWSVDMQGNVYMKDIPDLFFRDLSNSKQNILMSEYLKTKTLSSQIDNSSTLLLSKSKNFTPLQSDFAMSGTEASNFIKSGKFVKNETFVYRGEKSVTRIYKENIEQVHPKYRHISPAFGKNNYSRSPIVRRVNHVRVEHNRRMPLQRQRSNIQFDRSPYRRSPHQQLPMYPQHQILNRSRTPVRKTPQSKTPQRKMHRGYSQSLLGLNHNYLDPMAPQQQGFRKQSRSPLIGKRPPKENIFNKGLPVEEKKMKRNQPKSYTMVRNPGRGINLLETNDSDRMFPTQKSSKRRSERNKISITKSENKKNLFENVKISPFLQKKNHRKHPTTRTNLNHNDKKNLNKSMNLNKTVQYNTRQKSFLNKNSVKNRNQDLPDPILEESDTLNLTNPNFIQNTSFKNWSHMPSPIGKLGSKSKGDTTIMELRHELSSIRKEKRKDRSASNILADLSALDVTAEVVNVKNINYFDEEEEDLKKKSFSFESPVREKKKPTRVVEVDTGKKGTLNLIMPEPEEEEEVKVKSLVVESRVSDGALTFKESQSSSKSHMRMFFDELIHSVKKAKIIKTNFDLCKIFTI